VDPVSVEDSEEVLLESFLQEVDLEEALDSEEDLDLEEDSVEVMVGSVVDLLEDKPSDMSTSTLPQMKLHQLNPELSEFQEEETNTLTLSSSRLHLPHLPNRLKLSFQNKTNTRTWSTFC